VAMAEFPECPCRGYRECPMCHDIRPCGHFGTSRWCPPCQRLRKQRISTSPRRRAPMPAGRTCAGSGCDTRLSVYNREDLCAVCLDGPRRSAAAAAR
jgi:hypothetical protein